MSRKSKKSWNIELGSMPITDVIIIIILFAIIVTMDYLFDCFPFFTIVTVIYCFGDNRRWCSSVYCPLSNVTKKLNYSEEA